MSLNAYELFTLENFLIEYFILHFLEMCTLKTLVKFAISHLAPATARAWTISEGLHFMQH